MAQQGDTNAAVRLAREYGDMGPLIALERESEDSDAAMVLASDFDQYGPLLERVDSDPEAKAALDLVIQKRLSSMNWVEVDSYDQLKRLAQTGDPKAQYAMYQLGIAKKPFRWLCLAAQNSYPQALYRLGYLSDYGEEGVVRSQIQAYKWYRLASDRDVSLADASLNRIRTTMPQDDQNAAESLYRNWQPSSSQCPSDADSI